MDQAGLGKEAGVTALPPELGELVVVSLSSSTINCEDFACSFLAANGCLVQVSHSQSSQSAIRSRHRPINHNCHFVVLPLYPPLPFAIRAFTSQSKSDD